MKPKKTNAPYEAMDAKELARQTSEFDGELIVDTFRPLSKRSRARWEAVRGKLGRPRRGKGAQAISLTVERELLARCDALARKLKISRAGLIARGIRAVLAAQGQL